MITQHAANKNNPPPPYSGRITFYTEPPLEQKETHLSATIITEMSKVFDIDALEKEQTDNLKGWLKYC